MASSLLGEKRTQYVLVIAFIGIGIIAMGIRWLYTGTDQLSLEDEIWKVSLIGQFEVTKDTSIISSPLPKTGSHYKLISQRFFHPGLKILSSKRIAPGFIRAKATLSGSTVLLIDYHIQLSQAPIFQISSMPELTVIQREKYLRSDDNFDLSTPALVSINQSLLRNLESRTDLVRKIFKFNQQLKKETLHGFDDITNIIKYNKATNLGRAKLMVALCRLNEIPARLVSGVILTESELDTPYYWVEVYDEKNRWQAYEPEKGFEKSVPNHYVKFGYDNLRLFSVTDAIKISEKYLLTEDEDILDVSAIEERKNIFDIFKLQRLDFELKSALTFLLVLPFCVLLTAFIRHVIGFYPYGTFTAPLLALAMVYAETAVTLTVAGIVIFLALIGRAFLPKKLPRSSRLSIIFTFVAMSMVLGASVMTYFSLNPSGSIILLPTIILVAIVDRFYSYMDNVSTQAALVRLGVTVMIAFICVPILGIESLGSFTLAYPEVHFVTVALVLIFSSYKGRKLTDFRYLKLLGENKDSKRNESKTVEE